MTTSTRASRHDPRRAWTIAVLYFVTCWLAASFTGTLGLIRDHPLGPDGSSGDVRLWTATFVTAAVIWVGYWVIWPKGTTVADRPLHRVSSILFGVLYGTSEGVLYLAVWHVVVDAWGASIGTFSILFVLIAGYNAVWRSFVWDVWVTPLHNLTEWNTRKVLWVHAPSLLGALGHLMVFEALALFIGFETIALTGSAVFTRIPPPFPGE